MFAIRSRTFSHDDIKFWTMKVFEELFKFDALDMKTEVVIIGKTQGRTDIIAEDYIGIENKKSMIKEYDDALVQVDRFLTKFEKQKDSIMPIGLATDGEIWEFFIKVHGRLFPFNRFKVTKSWNNDDLKNALWKTLTTIRKKAQSWKLRPSADSIAEVFRPEGPIFINSRQIMLAGAIDLLNTNSVEFTSKFISWFELFNFVYNNFEKRCKNISKEVKDLDKISKKLKSHPLLKKFESNVLNGALELFFRHTYLAVLSKILVSMATLGEHQIIKETIKNPASIVSGNLLLKHGIFVAEPNDFFIWVKFDNEVGKLAASILHPLSRFSQEYDDDIFRHLYEIIVDSETRHEIGEFYTPKWLAQLIVLETIQDEHSMVLDPACGSGTFLIAALKHKVKLLKSKKKKLTSDIMLSLVEEIWGIDVNPLSVTLARTNLYLAIIHLMKMKEIPSEIRPKVYVADTFVLPRFSAEQEIALEQDPNTKIIKIPVTPKISIPIQTNLSIEEIQKYVETVGGRISNGLPKIDPSTLPQESANYIVDLEKTILSLRSRYGNNLWQFIIRNYCIPPLIKGKFDVVIGNPPWLVFREAKDSLQDIMDLTCKMAKIKPGAKAKTSFNLAVSFFITSMKFLKPGGIIGFVLPLSTIEGTAHYSFLKSMTDGKIGTIQKIYDLTNVSPPPFPHGLAPCILIGRGN